MSKIRELIKKKKAMALLAGVFAAMLVLAGVLPNAFAHTAYYVSDASVELDGVNDGYFTVSLKSPIADSIYSVEGNFAAASAGESLIYTLTALTPAEGITPSSNTVSDGRILWQDASWEHPLVVGADGVIWSATFRVEKDVPAGEYGIWIFGLRIASESEGYDTLNLGDIHGTLTVTRSDAPATKPNQAVTFRDGEGNVIGAEGVAKFYGDDDFVVTKQVTTGDGAITEYHPDDDGTGSIAHTIPGGDLVGVGEPGDVEICAWVAETENYAETRSCYTVHVSKRPLDITNVVVANKDYDGTLSATVNSVSFEDRNLGNEEYNVTAHFDDENVGENKVVRVSVTLNGSASNNYILNASNYNATATISPYHLVSENVELLGSGSYGYNPDGVEPEVRVTANTHGGVSTLVEGQDYEVSYSNNTNVGDEAHVTVTGKGNYTTGEVPVVIDFTIEPKGINNGNLVVPSSIVEGHIMTDGEIRVNVDGHDLARCANVGDSNCDYTLELSGNDGTLGGSVHVAVNGCNNYTGVAVADVDIVAKLAQTVSFGDVNNTVVSASYGDTNIAYTAMTSGDGAISYSSNNGSVATVNPTTGAVTIVGVGDAEIIAVASETDTYAEASSSYTLRVAKKVITAQSVTVANKTYDGVTLAEVSSAVLSESSLVFGTDFTAGATLNNPNVGTRVATATVLLSDDTFSHYCFEVASVCVNSTDVITNATVMAFALGSDNASVALSTTEYDYDGEAKEPTATVTVDLNNDGVKETTLTMGTDYEITYANNVNAGTATATISGKGNYAGTLPVAQFTINTATVTDVVVTAPAQTYTGSPLEPVPTVTGVVNGNNVTFTTNDYYVIDHGNFISAGDHNFGIASVVNSNYDIPITNGVFTINKAGSGEPEEMTAEFRIEAGKTLAELGERTEGFSWVNPATVVSAGSNHYNATYVKNNDAENYETTDLSLEVYGLTRITITTGASVGGAIASNDTALEGEEVLFTLVPEEGYTYSLVTVNLADKTADVSNNSFTLVAGTEDLVVTVNYTRAYEVVSGDGQEYVISDDGAATFEIDADYELFEGGGLVYVDNVLVPAEYYESWSGSTFIKFKADYMNSLSVGTHKLAVVFNDGGIARASFIVANLAAPEVADTGVFTGASGDVVAVGSGVVVFAILAGVMYIITKRAKRA